MLVCSLLRSRTDSLGKYEFCNLSPGSYVVLEINLPGFTDVSDTDGANDNSHSCAIGLRVRTRLAMILSTRGLLSTPAPTPVGQTAVPTSASRLLAYSVGNGIPTSASPAGSTPTPVGQTPIPTSGLPSGHAGSYVRTAV
jgi:hypothetical protein